MWVVVHLYVGLAIGASVKAPFWEVAVLVVASHVLLDLVPHWDYTAAAHDILWGWADFLAALATLIVGFAVLHMPLAVLAMGPISGAPDLDVLIYTITGRKGRKWFPSHWDTFPHGRCGPRLGIPLQLGVIVVSAAVFHGAG